MLYISRIRHFSHLNFIETVFYFSKIVIVLPFTFRSISHLVCYTVRSKVKCQRVIYFAKNIHLTRHHLDIFSFLSSRVSLLSWIRSVYVCGYLSLLAHGPFSSFAPRKVSQSQLYNTPLCLYLSPPVWFRFHSIISAILGSLPFHMDVGLLCEYWY